MRKVINTSFTSNRVSTDRSIPPVKAALFFPFSVPPEGNNRCENIVIPGKLC